MIRFASFVFFIAFLLAAGTVASAQDATTPAPRSHATEDAASKKDAEAEEQLHLVLTKSGNDRGALVHNLREYLQRYPDAPSKDAVYRALVESCQQLQNTTCAIEYTERLIALHPDDSEMMLIAVNLLSQQGDDASLTRAAGYVTRVLDRVEKARPDERSARESVADWQNREDRLRASLYYMRGFVEKSRRDYDGAAKDLQQSYSIRADAATAEELGEIAELHKDAAKAIEEYTFAFVLPENGIAGEINRRKVRMELGNVWRQVHGSEQGLSENILAVYDAVSSPHSNEAPTGRNKGAKEPFEFVLRKLDGTPMPMEPLKGKIVVLSFWATWCGPCRVLEPLFDKAANEYAGSSDIAFLSVNMDADEGKVPSFVAQEKWRVPVVYADGLEDFLNVTSLPTVVVLDRNGKIVYRIGGLIYERFYESLTSAIQNALSAPK